MFDALRFLTEHHIETFQEGNNSQPGWVNIRCPLCGDHSNHGGFHLAGGYYHCWRCGGSSEAWVVKQLLRVSYPEAVRTVEVYSGTRTKQSRRVEKKPFFVPGTEMERRHRRYLEQRGFDDLEIERKYGVLGTGRTGELAHRIVIPVILEGEVVTWQARTILDGAQPKYMACPNDVAKTPIKEVLYNLDNCRKRRVIAVEGVTDVWNVGDDCFATFGVATTKKQADLIADRFDELYILFDNEPEAQKRADAFAHSLAFVDVSVEVVVLDSDSDPGSADRRLIEEMKDELEL